MGTQVVRHTSRGVDITLNFASTENNPSWSFTQEGDGEIYDVSLTNVASYTVSGGSITPPYAVINGSSYAVSIVKTTAGQTASITFNTRRATNKTTSLSVPDFGQYDGRYLYVLLNNNTVQKLDSQLLLPANYAGAGAWTVSPVVATITLPTLPNSAIYTGIQFVKNGGVTKMFVVGGEANSFKWYASYIRLSDDLVYNLDFTTQNAYTTISNSTLQYNTPRNILYDFINEIIYIKSTLGNNGTTVLELSLSTLTATNLGYDSFADMFLSPSITCQYQSSPVENQFISQGDTSLINRRNYNCKSYQNNGYIFGYRFDLNRRICTGSTFGQLRYFDSNGAYIGVVSYGTLSVYSCSQMRGYYRQNTAFMTYINNYALVNWATASSKYRTTDKTLAAPNNYIFNLQGCYFSSLFFGFCGASTGVLSTRLLVFDPTQTNADFGYLDFASTVNCAQTNQLNI